MGKENETDYLRSCLKSAKWNVEQNQALLKEAWKRIDYLEGREAYLVGKLFDALRIQPKQEVKGEAWTTEEILKREG